jgi:hypothetical protein
MAGMTVHLLCVGHIALNLIFSVEALAQRLA